MADSVLYFNSLGKEMHKKPSNADKKGLESRATGVNNASSNNRLKMFAILNLL